MIRGVYPCYTLCGPTTKKKLFYGCLSLVVCIHITMLFLTFLSPKEFVFSHCSPVSNQNRRLLKAFPPTFCLCISTTYCGYAYNWQLTNNLSMLKCISISLVVSEIVDYFNRWKKCINITGPPLHLTFYISLLYICMYIVYICTLLRICTSSINYIPSKTVPCRNINSFTDKEV